MIILPTCIGTHLYQPLKVFEFLLYAGGLLRYVFCTPAYLLIPNSYASGTDWCSLLFIIFNFIFFCPVLLAAGSDQTAAKTNLAKRSNL